ncbi:MAG TPA: MerR family transcriptional regulator [Candidatus Bathyarchaeia archaeon]|nr:MerR family transcriptional regulator [Candidatus Bathyarchaeia archaeon]
MSDKEPILTISVAAKLLGLHSRTLMFYEQAGLIEPHRTSTNRRLFSIEDLNQLQFITFLTQKEGINLKGVKLLLEAVSIAEESGLRLRRRLFPSFKLKKLI